MKQLNLALRTNSSNALTVEFNAWRHDKEEALWAAFALDFTRKLSEQLSFRRRCLAHARLFFQRFNWQEGWLDALRAIAVGLIFIAATVAILVFLFAGGLGSTQAFIDRVTAVGKWQSLITGGIASGGIAAYVAVVVSLGNKLSCLVGNPLAIRLQRYATSPDYESRVAFIEQFHEDFGKILKVYAGRASKVYVFIDDLDRCEVPKAAELMQALNLMLSESELLVYVIGMDREQVAAGYAVKHSALLPFLAPTLTLPGTPVQDSFDAAADLDYGYAFIEKFIQLPFHVPQPTDEDVERLLDDLSTQIDDAGASASRYGENLGAIRTFLADRIFGVGGERHKSDAPATTKEPSNTEGYREVRKSINLDVAKRDSDTIRNIVRMVGPALDYNPRRILQFINLYRLRVFIAYNTALFDEVEGFAEDVLTLEQLGKFVAISLRWPLLLVDLDSDPTLLTSLQKVALDEDGLEQPTDDSSDEPSNLKLNSVNGLLERWSKQQDLLELLRAGCLDEQGGVDSKKARAHSLSMLNVKRLLQVSPQTQPTVLPSTTPIPPSYSTLSSSGLQCSVSPLTWQQDGDEPAGYSFTFIAHNFRAYPMEINSFEVTFQAEDAVVATDYPRQVLGKAYDRVSLKVSQSEYARVELVAGPIVESREAMRRAMRCDTATVTVVYRDVYSTTVKLEIDIPMQQDS